MTQLLIFTQVVVPAFWAKSFPWLFTIIVPIPACAIYYLLRKERHIVPDDFFRKQRLHILEMFFVGLAITTVFYHPTLWQFSHWYIVPLALGAGIWIWRIVLRHREPAKP